VTREQLSPHTRAWFKRHLGDKTAPSPLSRVTAFGELESLRMQALSQSVHLFVEHASVRQTLTGDGGTCEW
jgi:hypothetical protein